VQKPGAVRLVLTLIVGITAVSCGSIFIRLASAPAMAVAAYRVLWATALLTPFAVGRPLRELRLLSVGEGFLLAASGVALAFHFAFWIASLSYTSVASSVVLVDTTPFFIGLASRWVMGKIPPRAFWVGLAVAFIGCLVIFQGDWLAAGTSTKGNLLALAGAAAMAAYLLIGGMTRSRLTLVAYVWPVYGTAAATLLAGCLVSGTPLGGYHLRAHLCFFLLGLVPQCIGHTTYNWSLRWLSPSLVGLISLAEPVGASFLAWLVLDESLTWAKVLGGGIILAGIYVATRSASRE
jgi:drug/metabolite transporter (DMT)-like permease